MARRREELSAIIRMGESVLLPDGRVITEVSELPSEIELAGDDIVRRQAAIGDLEAQQKALEAEIAKAKAAAATKQAADAVAAGKADSKPAEAPKVDAKTGK